MLKYFGKRLLRSLVTLFIIVTFVFTMMRAMPIEGYFQNYEKLSNAQIDAGLQSLGLKDPLTVQLLNFYKNAVRGDFGVSHKYRVGVPVTEIISQKLPISLGIGLAALGLALLAGLPLGILMARSSRSKYRIGDRLGTVLIVAIQAIPAAIYYLMIQFYVTDWSGLPMRFSTSNPASWILPIFSLSLNSLAFYAMWLRRYMVDESSKEYVKLARAKGVTTRDIYRKHIFRNAIVPLVQFLPSSVVLTMIGSLYIESLYSIPGMGGLLINAVQRQDNTLVQALVLFYAIVGIFGMLAGDLLMSVMDPRIVLAGKEAR